MDLSFISFLASETYLCFSFLFFCDCILSPAGSSLNHQLFSTKNRSIFCIYQLVLTLGQLLLSEYHIFYLIKCFKYVFNLHKYSFSFVFMKYWTDSLNSCYIIVVFFSICLIPSIIYSVIIVFISHFKMVINFENVLPMCVTNKSVLVGNTHPNKDVKT